MTPADLEAIRADAAAIRTDPSGIATEFYATLFELDPSLEAMFPDDMGAQRALSPVRSQQQWCHPSVGRNEN